MHAQVAVAIVVYTAAQTVRRIGTQSYDQCNGRDQRDQAIPAKTRAHDEERATCRGNERADESQSFDRVPERAQALTAARKPSLRADSGQPMS